MNNTTKKLTLSVFVLMMCFSFILMAEDKKLSNIDEFKKKIVKIIKESDRKAFLSLILNDEIPIKDRQREPSMFMPEKKDPISVHITKYYPNSIPPILSGVGAGKKFVIFSQKPDYYCLIEQTIDDWYVSMELGLCKKDGKIFICGQKYLQQDVDMPRNNFELISHKLPNKSFVVSKSKSWQYSKNTSGYEFTGCTIETLIKFLESNLNVVIKNKTKLKGKYDFEAPVGSGESISRTIIGLKKIGLELREEKKN